MTDARVRIDPAFAVGPVDRRLFGSFVEHLGRCVYEGIYEPGHPSADAQGFRRDVLDLVRELGVSTVRYPGGNFVSGYRWEDGVGPVEERPKRLDLAWRATETNEVGLHEFAAWCEAADVELMYAVNLGTRGVAEALDVLEYANVPGGTELSDARRANGREKPFDIRMWCLGNEMDGPWQLGHSTPEEYGRIASQTAKALRQIDKDLELVACGSSGRGMPTFGTWERVVLERCYEDVDYISCHAYYEERDGDLASFLASGVDMDRFIEEVIVTADHVKALKRSDKRIDISFDEWNVWYMGAEEPGTITGDEWPEVQHRLENVYSVADAVVVGGLLISLLRHADRVRSASLAQLVNAIAPIMTAPGGPAWRQTTFFPFALTSHLARGVSLDVRVEVASTSTAVYGDVPLVDVAATYDDGENQAAVFLLNRSLTDPLDVTVEIPASLAGADVEAVTLHDADPKATNTRENPDRVAPASNPTARLDGTSLTLTLPPVSWTAVRLGAR
ncbi:MAG: alpha-N-arabinofuranosidase [Actinomycetales bacterium]|nr:alpha-N-arabinofuranosidase [Actinomycetales bacterium]